MMMIVVVAMIMIRVTDYIKDASVRTVDRSVRWVSYGRCCSL